MNRKLLAVLSLAFLVLNAAGLMFADTKRRKAKPRGQVNALVAQLPDSDVVAVIDTRRFFDNALPKLLASQPNFLEKLTAGIENFQSRTGIDIRKFDRLAIGVRLTNVGNKEIDGDPVVLAKGSFNAGSLIAAAKLGTNGGYREEKVGDRTIYVFSVKDVTAKNTPGIPGGLGGAVSGSLQKLWNEIAVGALDANTLAIGSFARVRETFEARTTVAPELTMLLAQKADPVFSFAARTPEGLDRFVPMDNDELAKNLDSVRYLSGWTDVAAGNATIHLMTRASNSQRAQGLYETVVGLQTIGAALLGGSKKPENKVYARLVENAKIARTGAEVTLDLSVPQGDIDLLLASLKK